MQFSKLTEMQTWLQTTQTNYFNMVFFSTLITYRNLKRDSSDITSLAGEIGLQRVGKEGRHNLKKLFSLKMIGG